MRQIDLEPDEYKTEPRKGEPMFGPAWPIIPGVILSVTAIVLIADGTIFTRIVGGIVGALIMGIATAFIYF
jgi:hypothetical protein